MHARMDEIAADVVEVGPGRQRPAIGRQRLVVAPHLGEDGRQRRPGVGVVGRIGDDALQDSGRFRETPLKRQAIAGDQHRLGIARGPFQRLFGEGERLAGLVLAKQDARQIGQDRRAIRHQRQRGAQALLGAGRIARIGTLQRLEEEGPGAFGIGWRGGGDGGFRRSESLTSRPWQARLWPQPYRKKMMPGKDRPGDEPSHSSALRVITPMAERIRDADTD